MTFAAAAVLAFASVIQNPAAPQNAVVRVTVTAAGAPVADASVVVGSVAVATDDRGSAVMIVPAGPVTVTVVKPGLEPASLSVTLQPGETRPLAVDLLPQSAVEEHVTVAAATRTGRHIEDEPVRVEVLDREELEEKLMMTPGDIVMLLNEMGGLRVQATSPSLGAASIRIQGMRGRYTRFLSDGLPLFGEQVGSFGLLQIPPVDLGGVEVIKGVASSLYGAGALGGVVNLISKRPGARPEAQALINRSTRGATDASVWYSAPLSDRWGLTLVGSADGQARNDVDDDGWADLARYARGIVRPRLFWDDRRGRSFVATAGLTWEDRTGGTVPGAALRATGLPYTEALATRRFDAGAAFQTLLGGGTLLSLKGSMSQQGQHHQFGDVVERDDHDSAFGEATLRRTLGRHTIVGGLAFERDSYTPIDLPQFAYAYNVPGAFAQDDFDVARWLAVSASGRFDEHSRYGGFFSPRIAALFRGGDWSTRISYGVGFFAPTPLTEETDAAGLSRLQVRGPLRPERGRNASVDVTRAAGGLSTTVTLFGSSIRDPIDVERTASSFVLRNLDMPTTTVGVESVAVWRRDDMSLVGTYTYVRSREDGGSGRVEVPLTPRHSVGIDFAWEWADTGRIGLEWYFTGRQRLEDNPYRDESHAYSVFGALVERRVGRYRLFLNGENLTDVRQTRWEPLLRPSRASDGRWTIDAWAPLDGRNINGGVRVLF